MPAGAPSDSMAAWILDDVKSRAGRRTIALPARLVGLLTKHQAAQQPERTLAGDLWDERGFVFTKPTGQPLDPRSDNREWAEFTHRRGRERSTTSRRPGTPPPPCCSSWESASAP
jgi:hypothetical protein